MNYYNEKIYIELQEYVPSCLPQQTMPSELAEHLWKNHSNQINVEFPSPITDQMVRLTSKGWIGYIPLTKHTFLYLKPKVNLKNVFRMLEYAYGLKSFQFLDGLIECETLKEFFEYLAQFLSICVLNRSRKGLYRAYIPKTDTLPYACGRLIVKHSINRPWEVKLPYLFEDHTPDIRDNQILAWTLFCIARSGLCTERTLPVTRKAYRSLRGMVSKNPCTSKDCIRIFYNRLNNDYKPLHALCRFFLDHIGPSHELGGREMLPFLVNMNHLYERFVARWLKENMPSDFDLKIQEKIDITEDGSLFFRIDIVIYDMKTKTVIAVLDTKYKTPDTPDKSDINQAIAYAEVKGCQVAVLIYPEPLKYPINKKFGRIRVFTMTFSLSGNLDLSGKNFLNNLGLLKLLQFRNQQAL